MIKKKDNVTPSTGIQLRERGVFNLDKLYKEMKVWFDKNKYNFNEKEHSQKNLDKGKEIIISWEGIREVTNYIEYHISVNFLLQEINSISDNLNNGFAKITFTGYLLLDHKKKWQKGFLSNFLFKAYNNYIIKKEIQTYEKKLYNEIIKLHNTTKEVLEFHR